MYRVEASENLAKETENMSLVNKFRERLVRSEVTMRGRLRTAGGTVLEQRYSALKAVQAHIKSLDDWIKPDKSGHGVIGEATFRASNGGLF
ncbi:hypothetical protein HYS95_01640 [Candidatus Daviesbacteria bacterium]|nr:hypothetical protein [Candidatus Daviesbacteria bacterium]